MDSSQITKLLQKQNTRYINRCQPVDSSTLTYQNQIQSSKYITGTPTCNSVISCNIPTQPGCPTGNGICSYGGQGKSTSLMNGSSQQFPNVFAGAAGSASRVYTSANVMLQQAGKQFCGVPGTSTGPASSYVIEPACGTTVVCDNIINPLSWYSISGFPFNPADLNGTVQEILVAPNGNIYVGGGFNQARQVDGSFLTVNGIAMWDGVKWNTLDTGINGNVLTLALNNNILYVGGDFTIAGGTPANRIASWNIGTQTWSALGTGMDNFVNALVVNNNILYAGGSFTLAGGTSANYIASWNIGTQTWSALGTGIIGISPLVLALVLNNNILYVGGNFTIAGGISANYIASWNIGTQTWSALGTGVNDRVRSLATNNNIVYAGGDFTLAGGTSVNRIASWNGTTWSALGTGVNNLVLSLATNNNILYAGGSFTTAGGISANRIASWNGTTWSALGTGVNNFVRSLATNNNIVYAGGDFTTADSKNISRIARYLTFTTQTCKEYPNATCSNTNGPINDLPLPVNNQSNPYLPPFDTYYKYKNPESQCKNCADKNLKHFVKQCHTRFPDANNGVSVVCTDCQNTPQTCDGCVLENNA
jgi:hypothetical protein